jgi:hypothetical protein
VRSITLYIALLSITVAKFAAATKDISLPTIMATIAIAIAAIVVVTVTIVITGVDISRVHSIDRHTKHYYSQQNYFKVHLKCRQLHFELTRQEYNLGSLTDSSLIIPNNWDRIML